MMFRLLCIQIWVRSDSIDFLNTNMQTIQKCYLFMCGYVWLCVAFWVELSECVTLDWGAGMHFWGVFTSPRVLLGVTQHLFGVINERDTLLHNAFRYIFHY